MAITLADFNKIWASSSPLTPYSFSDDNYNEGWNFIGQIPPSRQMWDFLQKNNDEKMQYLANNYLPLSGGTMTGAISISNGNVALKQVTDNSSVRIYGGTDEGGSNLWLFGKNSAGAGRFSLFAYDGTNMKELRGKTDGALTWNNNTILTTANGLPLSGGTMTGNIIFDNSGIYGIPIKQKYDSAALRFCGGTDESSANLWLFGKNSAGAGRFDLVANDGSDAKILRGSANGTLTWVGNDVLTAGNYNSYALPLSGGTMTGNLQGSITDRSFGISNQNSDYGLALYGYNGSENSGATLLLFGKDALSNAGYFQIKASDGTNKPTLEGKPDGTLTWDGQPIQTSSDKRLKQDFADVPNDVLEAWSKVEWKQFKYKADVERKGDSCRFHTGLVAQDVKEVGEANNVDLLKYGILCHDVQEATEEQEAVDLWTVRYEEALAMEVIYLRNEIKKLHEEIKALRTE